MSNELQKVKVMSIVESMDNSVVTRTMQKIHDFQQIVQQSLKKGHDYGIIPGCEKPTLLKPGAEKIKMLMGVSSAYEITEKVEDYEKGFFAYNVKAVLSHNGSPITEGVGNCNSREKKYARQDPYTIANTILKMAKKRADVDATLTLASLSDIFTQDLEDNPEIHIQARPSHADNQGKSAPEHVLTFGKHKGKTLGEMYSSQHGYFRWLKENNEKMKPLCEEVERLAQGKQEEPEELEAVTIEATPQSAEGEDDDCPF